MTIITPGRGKLAPRDFIKALIVAAISPVLPIILDSINAGVFEFNWRHIWQVAAGSGLAYLIKNIFTPSRVVIDNPAVVDAVKAGELEVTTRQV